jgi:hypothetical protein
MVVGVITVLVLARRSTLVTFPLLAAVCLFTWISFGATDYWSGNLDDVFGGFGHIGASVNENVGARFNGSAARVTVVRFRMLFTGLVLLLAAIGFRRRARAGVGGLTFALLAVAPFAVLAAQPYGGEALLRAYLFALPFLAIYAAFALFPGRRRAVAAALLAAGTIAGSWLFLVARFGNERFEYVTTDERSAWDFVYDHALEDALVIVPSTDTGLRYERLADLRVSDTPGRDRELLDSLVDGAAGETWVVFTRAVIAHDEIWFGSPAGWEDDVIAHLRDERGFVVAYANADAQVLVRRRGVAPTAVDTPPPGVAPSAPEVSGP